MTVRRYVLDQILSGEATEVVVERIHEYLTEIGQNIRSGKIKLDEFIIFKRLGKAPEDYPDAKSQPHVQVALKMKVRGSSVRAGDVIPYVFCLGDPSNGGKVSQAERAHHPDEIRRATDLQVGEDLIFCFVALCSPNANRLRVLPHSSSTSSC